MAIFCVHRATISVNMVPCLVGRGTRYVDRATCCVDRATISVNTVPYYVDRATCYVGRATSCVSGATCPVEMVTIVLVGQTVVLVGPYVMQS